MKDIFLEYAARIWLLSTIIQHKGPHFFFGSLLLVSLMTPEHKWSLVQNSTCVTPS
jgi:hypothetical protein